MRDFAFRRLFNQRPVQAINAGEGLFFNTTPEEKVTVNGAPHFGKCHMTLARECTVPAQWKAEIFNARVHSPSFAVTSGDTVWITDESAELPYCSAGYSDFFLQDDDRFAFRDYHYYSGHYKEAALIAHRTSFNYFHLMFETIPKILLLKEMDPQAKIPAILDARIPVTLKQLLTSMLEPQRPRIDLVANRVIAVDRLHVFSTPSHLPDDDALRIDLACVSPTAINRILSAVEVDHSSPQQMDLMWVSRNAYVEQHKRKNMNPRDVSNNRFVEQVMYEYGARFFAPEQYAWQSQCDLFASAKAIAMVSGSAATNLLFARPGTRVLLMCKNIGVNPGLFDVVLDMLGLPHAWLLGIPEGFGPHTNFHVLEDDLRRAMEWLMHGKGTPDGVIPTK